MIGKFEDIDGGSSMTLVGIFKAINGFSSALMRNFDDIDGKVEDSDGKIRGH